MLSLQNSPNNQSQSNGSTPPSDSQTNEETGTDQNSPQANGNSIDESSLSQNGLNGNTSPPKQRDDRPSNEEQDMLELENSRQENNCSQQPDHCSGDELSDITQHQNDSNIQTPPTLQKSVTAPPSKFSTG